MNLERSENLKYSRVNKGIHICLYRNCHLIVSEREDTSNKGVMCWEVEVGWWVRGGGVVHRQHGTTTTTTTTSRCDMARLDEA